MSSARKKKEWRGAVSPPRNKIKKMTTWYSLHLGDGMTSGLPAAEIEETFDRFFSGASLSSDLAVFTRPESEGRLHCEVIAYFSPAAAQVAKMFDAEPCEKPARAGLGLLAGDEAAWSVLFPEEA
jgi:hypothetical protein